MHEQESCSNCATTGLMKHLRAPGCHSAGPFSCTTACAMDLAERVSTNPRRSEMTRTLSTQVVMRENPSTEEQSERGTDAPQPPPLPTLEQSAAYQRAWAYFNEALFDGRLKP